MQFLKTLFWVVLAVVMVLFAHDNWQVAHVKIGTGLIVDVKLPVLVFLAYLIGLVPTLIIYRARLWSLKRRLETQGQTANGPQPVPVSVPAPVRRSSAPSERAISEPPGDAGEATDARPWPTA